jgi:hypothetical protein
MWGYKWNARSPGSVIAEMRKVLELDPQIGGFIIMDDLFAVDPSRVRKICSMIKESGLDIVWNCEIRADMITEELVRTMKGAGCCQVLMGIETGSQRLLDLVRKDITVEDIRRASSLIHEAGMEVYAMLERPAHRDGGGRQGDEPSAQGDKAGVHRIPGIHAIPGNAPVRPGGAAGVPCPGEPGGVGQDGDVRPSIGRG